jgi:hypothetical protein
VAEEGSQPSEEEIAAHRDEGYRLIGRYFVVFSEMVQEMRLQMARVLQQDIRAFARKSPRDLCKAFFRMCQEACSHEPDEAKTASRMRDLVLDEITMRDDVAHAEWFAGGWERTGLDGGGMSAPKAVPPHGYRTSKDGKFYLVDGGELDARSDEIERVTKLLREYGRVCFGMHRGQPEGETVRVRDVVCLEKKRPVLGPKAPVFPRDRV